MSSLGFVTLLMINVNIIVTVSSFPVFWETQFLAIQVQV